MKDPIGISADFRIGLTVLIGVSLICAAHAQQTPYTPPAPTQTYPAPAYPIYPTQNPSYPNTGYPAPANAFPAAAPAYPGQPPPGYPQGMATQPPHSHFFRDLFAQTIAAVLQTSTGGLLGAITGRIMEWFTRKGANPANMAAYPNNGQYPQYGNTGYTTAPGYPTTPGYPATPGYPTTPYAASTTPGYQPPSYPSAQTPTYPQTSAYPTQTTTYPTASQPAGAYPGVPAPTAAATLSAPAYPTAAQPQGAVPAASPALVYDARSGQLVPAAANPFATRGLAMEGALYAGIAYEVHVLGADGSFSAPVNPATNDFHTGDKFMLYYRPSLPGHMDIYNINAAGNRTLIDSSNMAAGAMVGLGPYQFTNDSGDETLLLVLSPCSTPQLITATRDIVKVDAAQPPQGTAVQLGSCGAPTARGLDVHTRDIEKVAVEGTTSFALDPVSPKELKSGQVTPREIPIVFHHR